jgi:hypothetical protein
MILSSTRLIQSKAWTRKSSRYPLYFSSGARAGAKENSGHELPSRQTLPPLKRPGFAQKSAQTAGKGWHRTCDPDFGNKASGLMP